MKKEFQTPEINVMMFDFKDVITASDGGVIEPDIDEGEGGKGELPIN